MYKMWYDNGADLTAGKTHRNKPFFDCESVVKTGTLCAFVKIGKSALDKRLECRLRSLKTHFDHLISVLRKTSD